jgi:hypothetical protein
MVFKASALAASFSIILAALDGLAPRVLKGVRIWFLAAI